MADMHEPRRRLAACAIAGHTGDETPEQSPARFANASTPATLIGTHTFELAHAGGADRSGRHYDYGFTAEYAPFDRTTSTISAARWKSLASAG
jgi:hypothetical protein